MRDLYYRIFNRMPEDIFIAKDKYIRINNNDISFIDNQSKIFNNIKLRNGVIIKYYPHKIASTYLRRIPISAELLKKLGLDSKTIECYLGYI
jgi:hypothetical protein